MDSEIYAQLILLNVYTLTTQGKPYNEIVKSIKDSLEKYAKQEKLKIEDEYLTLLEEMAGIDV